VAAVSALVGLAPAPALSSAGGGTGVRPVRPAGTQIAMPGRPMALALSPDGSRMLVSGQGIAQSLAFVDVAGGRTLQRLRFDRPRSLSGAAVFSADGRRAYVGGGGSSVVWRYAVGRDRLVELRPLRLGPIVERNEIARGLTVPYPAGLAISRDGGSLYVADELGDAVHAIDIASGRSRRIAAGDGPLAVVLHPDGRRAYVARSAGRSVGVLDLVRRRPSRAIGVGAHPTALALDPAAGELYVANADADSISVIDIRRQRVLRTIGLTSGAAAARGRSPIALALDRERRRLYIAAAGDNAVDVVALAAPGSRRGDRVLGVIPTGAYPSALALERGGRRLLVANAKGTLDSGSGEPDALGTVSRVTLPTAAALARPTATRRADTTCPRSCEPGDAALQALRGRIDHVVYIVKENRAYDDLFADLGPNAAGAPRFGSDVAPNHRELARRFVLFDNFHAVGAVSPDGKAWSLGGLANAYVERNWPATYAFRRRPSDYLGLSPAASPPQGQLWDSLARAGRSYRNYGAWASGTVPVRLPPRSRELAANTDANFPGYNRRFSDQRRVAAFLEEFRDFERRGRLPDFLFVSLTNDHLLGTRAGYRTPEAMMADNDLALGRIVDAISHSPFWSRTAIFVVDDDAQGKPGGQSRTVALVISPHTQRGAVDSTRYDTLSMLGTMETLLGLDPLSQFDGSAQTMTAAFDAARTDRRPYDAIVPAQALDQLNPGEVRVGVTFALGVSLGFVLGAALVIATTRIGRIRRRTVR